MKKIFLALASAFLLFSCDDGFYIPDSAESMAMADGRSEGGSGNGDSDNSGLITAGEWNDLSNWAFWESLMNDQDFGTSPEYWQFYPIRRIAVHVKNGGLPVANTRVQLKKGDEVMWSAYTDNLGHAELWMAPFSSQGDGMEGYSVTINGQTTDVVPSLYSGTPLTVEYAMQPKPESTVQIAFVVDATGSMSDEMEFLKDDLENVIERVKNNNSSLRVATSSVFYRDEGDEYVVKNSPFTYDLSMTANFIRNQSADGGGDFPEAVHTALDLAINQLVWDEDSRTRLLFLLLDAPPHNRPDVISNLKQNIPKAAEKGIKIIPITASGIDKPTEFLMRFFAILTNGTYVFITDDSGIGNDHLEPTVGEYQVEYLNDLMVRLINKYSE